MSAAALAAVLAPLAFGLAAAEPAAAENPFARFCTVLDAIIAAEDEPSPFASLVMPARYGNMEWSKQVVPGFEYCVVQWIERGRAVTCARNLAPPELTANNLALETGACLGQAPTPSVWDPQVGKMEFEYEAVRIVISQECDERCHVGRSVSYSIEARRKP